MNRRKKNRKKMGREERRGKWRKKKKAGGNGSPQGGAQASKFGFYKLIECIIKKCHGVKQNAKNVPLVKQNVNEILSLYLRKTEN